MKIINSQKRNKYSYFVTLSVSDYDIEMLENIAHCEIDLSYNNKWSNWLCKQFKEFQKLWKKYD